MTHPTGVLPANATTELGSEMSPYRQWFGVDPATGDLYDWQGEWAARDIEDMLRRDGKARAVEQVITQPLRAAPLAITGGKGDRGEAEFVNDSLDRMSSPLQLVIGQGAQSLIYRATFLEKVFTVDRGYSEYECLAWRPPDACALTRDRKTGRVTGFRQQMTGQVEPARIKAEKAVIFLHGAHRDPVRGVSEMAVAYRCFRDKQKVRALWFLFLENAALPRIIAESPSGEDEKLVNQLVKLKNSGVAAVPPNTNVVPLDVSGKGADQFMAAIKFLDLEMAGSVLASFLSLVDAASSGRGSFALSKDQTDFFTACKDSDARELSHTLRGQVVTPLVRLNFGPDAVVPDVTLGPISGVAVEQMLSFAEALAGGGPNPFPQVFVDEVVEKVAGLLNLDTDKVHAAVLARAGQLSTSAAAAVSAPVSAAADVATAALTEAGSGGGPTLRALTG